MKDDFTVLFSCENSKRADLIGLVLASQDIVHLTQKEKENYVILVKDRDRKKAVRSMHLYFKENRFFRIRKQIEAFPLSSFYSVPVFVIMALLTLIHVAVYRYQVHDGMVLHFGASALYILQDDTFRAITALFLHADGKHLLGNLAGLIIFAAPLLSITGFGSGPFLLLLTGTCGNLINAFAYRTAHLSIGASTAVMGAAGLLVAHQMLSRKHKLSLNTLMPLISGAVLVSLFSQGENTDVWAHVFGFLSGICCGLFFLPANRLVRFKSKEPLFLFLTVVIVIAAFWSGR